MAENVNIPRQVVIATEVDPQMDYDLHYTICHLHPDDIKLIADAVTANLLRLRLVKPWMPGQ